MSKSRKIILEKQYNQLLEDKQKLILEIDKRIKKNQDEVSSKLTDIADIASNSLQDELSMMVASEEIKKLKKIEDALIKIEKGNYGICTTCSCEINNERLKALPFVTLCVKCQEKEESEGFYDDEWYSYGRETNLFYENGNDVDDKDMPPKLTDTDNDLNKDFLKNRIN